VPLITATTDFLRTLSAVPGHWGKLRYLLGLRESKEHYHHWGLERVHGREAAHNAIRESHESVVVEILRTPLRDLVDDAELSSGETRQPAGEFVDELARDEQNCLPPQADPAPRKHFSSAVRAVKALLRIRQAAGNHPDA
jgi:hypothetical protein